MNPAGSGIIGAESSPPVSMRTPFQGMAQRSDQVQGLHECSKLFEDFPCSHRQWRHQGHCRFVHGYSRSFQFWFRCTELDENGFVVDFSDLKDLRQRLAQQFDHTFLVNADDPLLHDWQRLAEVGALDLRVMTNVGMETSAELVWGWANELLWSRHGGRTCCWQAEARENHRNAALFKAVPTWFSPAVSGC